jgi:hypothetical protein
MILTALWNILTGVWNFLTWVGKVLTGVSRVLTGVWDLRAASIRSNPEKYFREETKKQRIKGEGGVKRNLTSLVSLIL